MEKGKIALSPKGEKYKVREFCLIADFSNVKPFSLLGFFITGVSKAIYGIRNRKEGNQLAYSSILFKEYSLNGNNTNIFCIFHHFLNCKLNILNYRKLICYKLNSFFYIINLLTIGYLSS